MRPGDEPTTSRAFPMVAPSGRIYVHYSRNPAAPGGYWVHMHCGRMDGVYSDDNCQSWSQPQAIAMPTSPYDDPQGKVPPEWAVWQKPIPDLSGGYLVGYSHWFSPAVSTFRPADGKGWTWMDSAVEFMRFTNRGEDPEPADIAIEYSGWGDEALRISHYLHPNLSVAQEPSLVRLPDDSLFYVMRSCTGYIRWRRSGDDGRTWANPRPLLYRDHGHPVLNPVVTEPINRPSDGRYILFHFHAEFRKDGAAAEALPRAPLSTAIGTYMPTAA